MVPEKYYDSHFLNPIYLSDKRAALFSKNYVAKIIKTTPFPSSLIG
jgi:hypothetical protein